jgi:hypothetical protein
MRRLRIIACLLALSFVRPAPAQKPSPTAGGHPDFGGIWNSATATPLQRPAKLKDKAFFTAVEAAEWERAAASQNSGNAAALKGVGTYNREYFEFGARVVKTLRTSIVTDPEDGQIPALTPAATAARSRRMERLRNPNGAQDFGLQDRCLVFPTAGPPMFPYRYNSNYQIIQTKDTLVVRAEMNDTRIIPLDGRPHLPSSVRLWHGDSVGHWEGRTLVVDTTNFRDTGGFFGDAGGVFGWDGNLHVVERFSFLDANAIVYKFEVDDPSAFTRPWKGELTLARTPGPIYEYACHEGNYALVNMLRDAQARKPGRDIEKAR